MLHYNVAHRSTSHIRATPEPDAVNRTSFVARSSSPSHATPTATPTRLRLQERTARSFELAPGLLDYFVAWLVDRAFVIRAPRSDKEYCRLTHGTLADGRVEELVIVYHSNTVLIQGAGWQRTAQRLQQLVEASPEQIGLFDAYYVGEVSL